MSNTVETILNFFRDNSYKFEYLPLEKEAEYDIYFTVNAQLDHPTVKWIDIRINQESEEKYTYKLEINKKIGEEIKQGNNSTLNQILEVIENYIKPSGTMTPDRE